MLLVTATPEAVAGRRAGIDGDGGIVRNLDARIVQALKQRAARHGPSAEAEHRAILEATLVRARRRSLAEVLAAMPDVGRDEDFERRQDD